MFYLLTIVLVILKALGYIHCSWLLALAPTLLMLALYLVSLAVVVIALVFSAVSQK